MSVFICQASLTLSMADKHELKILPLDGFQQLRVGRWENMSPPMVQSGVLHFVLITRKEVIGFKRKLTFISFGAETRLTLNFQQLENRTVSRTPHTIILRVWCVEVLIERDVHISCFAGAYLLSYKLILQCSVHLLDE